MMKCGPWIPPHHRIHVVVPFCRATLGPDWFHAFHKECAEKNIKFGIRHRHTHCQMDMTGMNRSCKDEDLVTALGGTS